MPAGTREQLAAMIVEGQADLPGPQLVIHGFPGDWSLCVNNAGGTESLWLASERRPTVMREFKTLDAAHNAALEVMKLADPLQQATNVRIACLKAKP